MATLIIAIQTHVRIGSASSTCIDPTSASGLVSSAALHNARPTQIHGLEYLNKQAQQIADMPTSKSLLSEAFETQLGHLQNPRRGGGPAGNRMH